MHLKHCINTAKAEKTKYEFSDDQIKVTAELSDASVIPDDASLVVTPVNSKTQEYNYEAYMDALNNGADKPSYTEDNTLLYDIAFIAEKDGEKVELQPEDGQVSIKVKFLEKQLTKSLGAKNADEVQLIHLPLKENVSIININPIGSAASAPSATLISIMHRATKLTIGSTRCPEPSGTKCASGGSISSILSTMIPLISPIECAYTSPSGAFIKTSATLSLIPSNTLNAT